MVLASDSPMFHFSILSKCTSVYGFLWKFSSTDSLRDSTRSFPWHLFRSFTGYFLKDYSWNWPSGCSKISLEIPPGIPWAILQEFPSMIAIQVHAHECFSSFIFEEITPEVMSDSFLWVFLLFLRKL